MSHVGSWSRAAAGPHQSRYHPATCGPEQRCLGADPIVPAKRGIRGTSAVALRSQCMAGAKPLPLAFPRGSCCDMLGWPDQGSKKGNHCIAALRFQAASPVGRGVCGQGALKISSSTKGPRSQQHTDATTFISTSHSLTGTVSISCSESMFVCQNMWPQV